MMTPLEGLGMVALVAITYLGLSWLFGDLKVKLRIHRSRKIEGRPVRYRLEKDGVTVDVASAKSRDDALSQASDVMFAARSNDFKSSHAGSWGIGGAS